MNPFVGQPLSLREQAVLSALQFALFRADSSGLKLIGPHPEWLISSFGPLWNDDEKLLSLPAFSAMDSFVQDTLGRFRAKENVHGKAIVFQETTFGENDDEFYFAGRITACFTADPVDVIFAIRPHDELDGISQNAIQLLRKSALDSTTFGHATHRHDDPTAPIPTRQTLAESVLPTVLASTDDAIIILSDTGHLNLANAAAKKYFPELPSHRPVFDQIYAATVSRDKTKYVERTLASSNFTEPIETTWEMAHPYRHSCDVRVSPIPSPLNNSGTVWRFRKQKESTDLTAHISEAQRLEAVGRLAGGVAHDFNNLLAIVMGNLTLLKEAAESETSHQEIKSTAELALQAADKAADLVRQLLGYSRKSQLKREFIDSSAVVCSAVELFRSTSPNVQVVIDIASEGWPVNGDADKLSQVFLNLFENASQAMEGQGQLTIAAKNFVLEDPAMAQAFECEQGHYIVLTVSDNGPGMSEAVREKVFEPFFTTKEPGEGTGLGLANALGIIRQHGGNMTCTSIPGQGTTFTIYLPRERYQANRLSLLKKEARSESASNRPEDKAPTILVVDDEELLRNVVRTMLHKNGYQTVSASNGEEALLKVAEHDLDAVVLDLAMPVMTGNEFFKALNEQEIDLPVIVASGYLVDTANFIRETGGTPAAFFSKPYQLKDLLAKINEIAPIAEKDLVLAG